MHAHMFKDHVTFVWKQTLFWNGLEVNVQLGLHKENAV